MTIGRVAAAAGVSVETHYQRRGLLEEPAKPIGGYRLYPAEMVNRICFIKRAKVLGFTLGDVAGLLRLDNREACATTRELAAQKVASIEQKLSQLQTMRSALTKLVRQCDKKRKRSTCPIIEILQRNSEYQPAANGIKRSSQRKSTTSSSLLGESPVANLLERSEGRLATE